MENTTLRKAFDRWLKAIKANEIEQETYNAILDEQEKLVRKNTMYAVLMWTFKEIYGEALNEQELVALFLAVGDITKAILEALEGEVTSDE